MIRRIFTAALGAIFGALAVYGLNKLFPSTSFSAPRLDVFFIIASGSALVFLGEKLHLVPTIEKVNEQSRPPSIYKSN